MRAWFICRWGRGRGRKEEGGEVEDERGVDPAREPSSVGIVNENSDPWPLTLSTESTFNEAFADDQP
jgi:hypothetical protein